MMRCKGSRCPGVPRPQHLRAFERAVRRSDNYPGTWGTLPTGADRTRLGRLLVSAALSADVPLAAARAALQRATKLSVVFDDDMTGMIRDLPLPPARHVRAGYCAVLRAPPISPRAWRPRSI